MKGDLNFIYLIGQPGAGKSTLFDAVLRPERRGAVNDPIPHTVLGKRSDGAELGARRAQFSGTDALPMDVIVQAESFVRRRPYPNMVAEGDRLACDRFFTAVLDAGYALELVYLDVPDALAAQRRSRRGSRQNESWVKGRATKAATLARSWSARVIDGSVPLDLQAAAMRHMPALRGILRS